MNYQPGTHIIASLTSGEESQLSSFKFFKTEIDNLIATYQLKNLGEVYHNFSPEGFTAVICLSESHISIHTWPEYGKVNLDIYLSNYQRNNDHTAKNIFEAMVKFFNATVENHQTIYR